MQIIEQGVGPDLVLVPGIQGRWEYVRPSVDALARWFRVLTFPLCGERSCDLPFEPSRGLENDVRQILTALDQHHLDRAVICGISFGGLVAVRFAAAYPERTGALVLASAPGPGWRLRPRHEVYARMPRLFGPLFLAEAPLRLRRELAATFPHRAERRRFVRRQLRTLATAPLSLSRMARRARLISTLDVAADCRRITAPTLVVTGEPRLDYVVPVHGTSEYARLIPNASHVVLNRTGHLGTITRPAAFAQVVDDFVRNVRLKPDEWPHESHRHGVA